MLYLKVDILNKNILLAANFLDRCPSCMANLVRHLCEFTCSPKQSEFIHVVSTEANKDGKLKKLSIYRYIHVCMNLY